MYLMTLKLQLKLKYLTMSNCWYKKIPGYLNKLPGILSTQNITKIVAYPGPEYSKLLTLAITQ